MTIETDSKISEADITRVVPGQRVHFSILSLPDRRYDTVLRTIEPAPDQILINNSGGAGGGQNAGGDIPAIYFNGRFDVDNADGILRPFMTAEVSFVMASAKNAVVVPSAALLDRKGAEAHVRVLSADGTTHDQVVRVGVDAGTDVQIVKGLTPSERVVLAGPGNVEKSKDGSF